MMRSISAGDRDMFLYPKDLIVYDDPGLVCFAWMDDLVTGDLADRGQNELPIG